MGHIFSACCGRDSHDDAGERRPLLDGHNHAHTDAADVDQQGYSGLQEQDALKDIVQNAAEHMLNAMIINVEEPPATPQLRALPDNSAESIMVKKALQKVQAAMAQMAVVHKEPVVVSFM
ncbi:hypothetical protein RI367_002853 [Sorochytrium milnesiophthora]